MCDLGLRRLVGRAARQAPPASETRGTEPQATTCLCQARPIRWLIGNPLGPVGIVELVWLLAHLSRFGYDSSAMLSRAQEARGAA